MHRIAFATSPELPELDADDRLALEPLGRRGVEVVPAVWSDPAVDWGAFELVVVRSCWDYHLEPEAFRAWIERLADAGLPVQNPPPVLRWNLDKHYLRELEEAGVPIAPTVWLPRGAAADLRAILAERGWSEAVVKPAVSLSAHGTWRTRRGSAAADQGRLERALAGGAMLVQRFLGEIVSEGEWSLTFLRGRFRHGVLKRPAAGDFRVQHEHGGERLAREPEPALVRQARAVLERVEAACLYARVDGVRIEGRLVLMELELIDPQLYLAQDPGAPERFAAAIDAEL